MTTGAELIAETLHAIGVSHLFGIVGIPVIEVAEACLARGIHFYGFRNEQSAVYAASIYGFLTGKPGVCLVVGGPGLVHALAGVENANTNRLPLLLLAGSSETSLRGLGAFQQLDQISLVKSAGAKYAEQPASPDLLPSMMYQAYQLSQYGKPGTTYIDLPADLITSSCSITLPLTMKPPLPAPMSLADPQLIATAVLALKEAQFPLLIVGKGSAWAAPAVRRLQSSTKLAFLPTPMGKGVVSDLTEQNVSACRSLALKTADVVLVLGARLNWILHFGKSPRYHSSVQFIQVSNVAEDIAAMENNIGLVGDVSLVAEQLAAELAGWTASPLPQNLLAKRRSNESRAVEQEQPAGPVTSANNGEPLQYHSVYAIIRETLQVYADNKRIVYVSEGANTMDISRSSFPLTEPRCRLDAGTNATMGVGMGYAISAKVADPKSLVVAIEGDSAFGFSAMEVETAVRYKLPMIIYVMNNSGVYHGADPAIYTTNKQLPSTALSLQTEYHHLAASLGALGFEAHTLPQVKQATIDALHANQVAVINVIIDPAKDKKLEFAWMSKM